MLIIMLTFSEMLKLFAGGFLWIVKRIPKKYPFCFDFLREKERKTVTILNYSKPGVKA